MNVAFGVVLSIFLTMVFDNAVEQNSREEDGRSPYAIVLGIAQDGGVPQAGTKTHAGWSDDKSKRLVVCLAVVDPATSQRWMIDATPDFPEQLQVLDTMAPAEGKPGLDGIFLTHAHIGHYTGLMYLGHEVMGAHEVHVYAMPRMFDYLKTNGPWDQLVRYKNIALEPLTAGSPVQLNERITIEPFVVPHRQEYSEVVGYRITGPNRSVLYIPDIDSWWEWDEMGTRIEDALAGVDVAYLDGTFFDSGEIPGRDMSAFPHPFIAHTMERLASLPPEERDKVRFVHFNHTNAALLPDSDARKTIEKNGFHVAEENERMGL
jgi:pyrroloquinoline quinone biosynthesis protein B